MLTINQALDKLFTLKIKDDKLIGKLQRLKMEYGGRVKVDEEIEERINELTDGRY